MANTINVKSTVAQAKGFDVEVKDTTLLCSRYFPTTAGDEFSGKEVLFDFLDSDLAKGAFLTQGFENGNVTNWVANSVVPPRVADDDVIDPKDHDRVVFERLCRAQGADLNREEAFQNLLGLKSARLAARTDRAKELLAGLVLTEGKIEFQQLNSVGSDTYDNISIKFYDPSKGADNHVTVVTGTDPYDALTKMAQEGNKRGKRYTDVLLGAEAWIKLSASEKFAKFAGSTFHSNGMELDFGEVDGATHCGTVVVNGQMLNVIVYAGSYKGTDNELHNFIPSNTMILISEGLGRCLQGGVTILDDNSPMYSVDSAFQTLTGSHIQTIYKDYNNQKLHIREESRPLPAPKESANTWSWVVCDLSIESDKEVIGEVYKGVKKQYHDGSTDTTGYDVLHNGVLAVGDTFAAEVAQSVLHVVRNGKIEEALAKDDKGNFIVPVDADRTDDGYAIVS